MFHQIPPHCSPLWFGAQLGFTALHSGARFEALLNFSRGRLSFGFLRSYAGVGSASVVLWRGGHVVLNKTLNASWGALVSVYSTARFDLIPRRDFQTDEPLLLRMTRLSDPGRFTLYNVGAF